LGRARQRHVMLPGYDGTDYSNTIPVAAEPPFPGNEDVERRIAAYVRWNATLYEVGFNHFFRGHDAPGGGDQLYFQGHASPGLYARAYVEGRLSEGQLD